MTLHLQQCPFEELATGKVFLRFRQRFEQHFSSFLDGYDEQQCFREDPYQEVYEFIGIARPRRRRFEKQPLENNASASEGEARRSIGREVQRSAHILDKPDMITKTYPLVELKQMKKKYLKSTHAIHPQKPHLTTKIMNSPSRGNHAYYLMILS